MRTRAYARGELDVAEEIRRRSLGSDAARAVSAPAAAAARAAGQAASIPHMGAHALGAAAYAAKAAVLAAPDHPETVLDEVLRWQLSQMSVTTTAALRQLPPVGGNRAGPLGPGLLSSGLLGKVVRDLQVGLREPNLVPGSPTADSSRLRNLTQLLTEYACTARTNGVAASGLTA